MSSFEQSDMHNTPMTGPVQLDDPRLTAWALGEVDELDPAVVQEIETFVEQDAKAAAFVQEVRQTAGWLEEGLSQATGASGLTAEQSAAIEAAASETPSVPQVEPRTPVRAWSRTRWTALATAAGVLVIAGSWLAQQALFSHTDTQLASGHDPLPEHDGGTVRGRSTGAGSIRVSAEQGPADSVQPGISMLEKEVEREAAANSPGALRSTREGAEVPSEVRRRVQSLRKSGPASPPPAGPLTGSGDFGIRSSADRGRVSAGRATSPAVRDQVDASREQYSPLDENEFLHPTDEPLSTFSIDVDTASYANVRRMLRDGSVNRGAVRLEELINYFPYAYAKPDSGTEPPFAIDIETCASPWSRGNRLLRGGISTAAIDARERGHSNLVFLLDVSGSMNNPDKLPLLKSSMRLLVEELGDDDRVAIVVYAGSSGLVLPPTSGSDKGQILGALERLGAGGSTNGGAGIELAYRVAQESFIEGGTNRVILATDGDFNVGVSDDASLVKLIEEKRESGVFLTVLGLGRGNLQDAKMEQLANKGNGAYAYIDSLLEAQKVLVTELGATLNVVAKDVKIQVEFNPLEVAQYRLLGYENRALAARDFADDSKDAGEIGAGHRVTAIYELVPANGVQAEGEVRPLKYQASRHAAGAAFSGELGTVHVRYKKPAGTTSMLVETVVEDTGGSFHEAGTETRFATAVAAFGMLMRQSKYAGDASWEAVEGWARAALGDDPGGYRAEFLALVARAGELGL